MSAIPDFDEGGYWDKVLAFMKRHKVDSFKYANMEVAFSKPQPVLESKIHQVDLNSDMPSDDVMAFYATEEFDRIIDERESAKKAPQE